MSSVRRERFGLLSLGLFVVAAIAFTVLYLTQYVQRTAEFSDPKVLAFYVGGVPVPLAGPTPVKVLPDQPVEISCECVPPDDDVGTALFRFTGPDGTPVERDVCDVPITFHGPIGSELPVALEFVVQHPDGTSRVVETRKATVLLAEVEESVEFYRFATPDGQVLETATLPPEVIPHVAATLALEGPPKDYAFLFFVREFPDGVPVLQVVVPPDDPEEFRALALPLREYRSYGGALRRYVAWPEDTDEVVRVGNPDDQRLIFEVLAGVFARKDIPGLLTRALTLEKRSDDRVVFTSGKLTMEEIRALAVHRVLSLPVRVVRAEAAPTESASHFTVEEHRPAAPPAPAP